METTMNQAGDPTGAAWSDVAAASATAEERAAQAAMPPRRFEELLPCKLTPDEIRDRGAELVKVLAKIDAIEAEKKAAVDQFKARIQIQESRARELRTAIEGESEDREVEVIESFELRLGVARTTRTDTGEQIRERALRSSELQPSLPAIDDSPQMGLDEAAHEDDIEPRELDEEPGDDGDGAISDPDAVLAAAPEEAAKPKRTRKAKA